MRLRTAQGKLKIEHSIIDGLRPVLETLLRENPEIKSVIPGVIRPVRDARGKLRLRVTTQTQTGWKALAFSAGARQEVFLNTSLSREKVESALAAAAAE
jgi:hypothetical protein